jgi:multimeric flavodoxin WrbA
MKVIGINGGPRKNWNTAKMLEEALAGASDNGAETKLYHLYDIDFKGCTSCFACKRLGGASYGQCGMRDGLTEVLADFLSADAVFVGSPIYFGDVTGELRSFLERLWFAGLAYSSDHMVLYPRRIPVKLIFTMNAPFENFHKSLNESMLGAMERFIGPAELLEAVDTLQFDDYAKYETSMFNVSAKLKRHKTAFPLDCKKAYELGKKVAEDNARGV